MAEFGSSENASDPSLCANNCGFFGNPKNRNLCSMCYAAFLKEKPISISAKTDAEDSQQHQQNVEDGCSYSIDIHVQESDLETNLSSHSASKCSETSESIGTSNAAARKSRCVLCNKKVGLLGFSCRCGGLFCSKHRHPEAHECDVDLKEIGRKILAKQNIECIGDKIEYRV